MSFKSRSEASQLGKGVEHALEQITINIILCAVLLEFHVFRAQANEDFVQGIIVSEVFFTLFTSDFIKRRLRDIEVASFDQIGHVATEESE